MMAAKRVITVDEKIRIVKLKLKVGTMIYDGRILLIYEPTSDDTSEGGEKQRQKKLLKSTEAGIVRKVLVKEGEIVLPGSPIVELEKGCDHPTVIKDLCAECGADLQKEKEGVPVSHASVSMVHMVPELKVNAELAQILGKADMDRLLEQRKLVLLVDLDQTLIHTTNDDIPNNIKDVYHFQLYGGRSPWYHTRLRPGTHNFLQGVSEKYELHICTFGSRRYAHTIARFLDADGKIFSHRILSRDECFDANSKTANLKALFPCGENMVCIIDDREDVWEFASNLIHVKPYHFFQHTGDIHAPPGLTKCENDDNKEGFDFTQLEKKTSNSLEKSDDAVPDSTEGIVKTENEEMATDVEKECNSYSSIKKESDFSEDIMENEKEDIITENEKECDSDLSIKEERSCPEVVVKERSNEMIVDLEEKCSGAGPADGGDGKEIESLSSSEIVTPPESSSNCDTNKFAEEVVSNEDDVEMKLGNDQANEKSADCSSIVSRTEQEKLGDNSIKSIPKNDITSIPPKPDKDGLITIEESDDYLLYLEEILKIIHSEFFKRFEETGEIPDLKQVIPQTRATVLRDVRIVFSGIVPNRMKLENSPAYKIARSLGATVTQNIESDTTHLVALRAGTAKVHAAGKRKNLKLVTPEWLWTCAERWEKVDERLFPLQDAKLNTESRNPPAHCRSPDRIEPPPLPFVPQVNKVVQPSQDSGFLFSINPLMSLSSEDIESMEGEVEDMFKESDDENETDKETSDVFGQSENHEISAKKRKMNDSASSSSSEFRESDEDLETRKRAKRKRKGIKYDDCLNATVPQNEMDDDEGDDEEDSDDETINDKFRRGEGLPSDLDMEYDSEEGTEEERESDGEWNVMGAALEREFLEE